MTVPLTSSRAPHLQGKDCIRLLLHEREALDKYISESLAAGIIRPTSSPARAGFFFLAKKDKTLQLCIVYLELNEITIKNCYPLPLMSPAFDPLQEAKAFTKLELHNAFHFSFLFLYLWMIS